MQAAESKEPTEAAEFSLSLVGELRLEEEREETEAPAGDRGVRMISEMRPETLQNHKPQIIHNSDVLREVAKKI